MRIAFDGQIFFQQKHGGVSRYFVSIADRMVERGHEVGIFAPLHQNEYLKALPAGIVRGVGLRDFPRGSGRLLDGSIRLMAAVAIRRWKPAVVHETYYAGSPVTAARSCRTVLTVYDMIHERYASMFPAGDGTAAAKRAAVARADHVICISHSTRRDLLELCTVDPDKVSVIHLGFDALDRVGAEHGRVAVPLPERPFLLFVGSRSGYKNFICFLEAVAASSSLRGKFSVIAFGGGAFTDQEIAVIERLGFVSGQVRQIGGDDVALAQYYSGAAAFVYPSLYEGFGLPPLEAMAQGCPVVCSNNSSIPEVVGDAGEYFDASDPASIAAAIERVTGSPERRAELVSAGADRLHRFRWEACADATLDVYSALANAA